MIAQMGKDPVQEAIISMEKQHEDEKQRNIDLYKDLLTLTLTLRPWHSMIAQMGEDPVQEAITAMEKQHEDEKQGEWPWP